MTEMLPNPPFVGVGYRNPEEGLQREQGALRLEVSALLRSEWRFHVGGRSGCCKFYRQLKSGRFDISSMVAWRLGMMLGRD